MSGPVPSKLVLLSDLDKCDPGSKVRFLGCVEEYTVQNATLRLKHGLQSSSPTKTADVNVDHVLEALKRTDIDVGSWINVIGYLERRKEHGIFVQAIAVWAAGDVNLEAYQAAVEARNKTA